MKSCLFVASGMSALEAKSFLGWGDLITLNRSLEFFDHALISFVGTRRKLDEMRGQFHKADLVVPLYDVEKYGIDYSIVPQEKLWLPGIAAVREPGKGLEALVAHIRAGNVVGRGAAALVCLQRLGYSRIWLFGHDGGHSRLPGLGEVSQRGYGKGRFCTEETAKHLSLTHAFYPNHCPEEGPSMSNRIFIGWDSHFPEPAVVLAHSLKKHSSIPLDIRFLDKRHLEACYGFYRVTDPLASTEFTYSRFLVPWLCGYEGRAIFMDNDMLCFGDIAELFNLPLSHLPESSFSGGLNFTCALRVVKHDYHPVDGSIKMGGAVQTAYPRKNWSSLMLMDCSLLKCWTKPIVQTASGAQLHRFQDVPDNMIGAIPPEWNSLDKMDASTKMIHWTTGMLWNDATKTWPHQDVWLAAKKEAYDASYV